MTKVRCDHWESCIGNADVASTNRCDHSVPHERDKTRVPCNCACDMPGADNPHCRPVPEADA